MKQILVVGAGFAGSVYARELADRGHNVEVIDKRDHVAGNAFDETLANGVRIHRYGPHLFHTNNSRVVEWLKRFAAFIPYEHRVTALLPDPARLVPLPVNRNTINRVFNCDLRTELEVKEYLSRVAVACEKPRNAGEYLYSQIGEVLTNLFFRPYTKKMWGHELEEMDAAVVKRIPIRFDDEDRYFPSDKFQLLPSSGYTGLVNRMLDHGKINLRLGTAFTKSMLTRCEFCFNSMPIDEYFEFVYGPLPYRSIKFHDREELRTYGLGATSVVNFTDGGKYTRQTDWSRLPSRSARETDLKTITLEEPCDYSDNNFERYYPVKTSDGKYEAVYRKYKALASKQTNLQFIGRCGTYQYLDMDQVINQSLQGARNWLRDGIST